jgi:hypothetical protein
VFCAGLMGATLEIQRSQQAEAMEQELLRARARLNGVSPLLLICARICLSRANDADDMSPVLLSYFKTYS